MVKFDLVLTNGRIHVETIDDAECTPGASRQYTRFNAECKPELDKLFATCGPGCSMKDSCPCLPIIGLHVAMWSMSGMLTETSRITSGYSLIHSRSRMNGFDDIRQRLKTVKAT